jgi:hypothetical protein
MKNRTLALALAAFTVAGCSGNAPSQLSYTDPQPLGTRWRLVKDPASTPTRLVLALVGADGAYTRGVGFNLQAGPGVRFLPFDDGLPIQDAGVYELKSSQPDPTLPADIAEPTFFAGGIKAGNVLTVGIFQKDRRLAAKRSDVPLLRIALAIEPGAAAGSVPLLVQKARIMPEDIGGYTDGVAMLQKSHLEPIKIAIGAIAIQ